MTSASSPLRKPKPKTITRGKSRDAPHMRAQEPGEGAFCFGTCARIAEADAKDPTVNEAVQAMPLTAGADRRVPSTTTTRSPSATARASKVRTVRAAGARSPLSDRATAKAIPAAMAGQAIRHGK